MDSILLSNVVQLRTIFRTTENIATYIGEKYLVPNWKIGVEDGNYRITHKIQGISPEVRKDIELSSLEDDYVKHELLTSRTMLLIFWFKKLEKRLVIVIIFLLQQNSKYSQKGLAD